MKHKKLIMGLFILVALTQLFLPFNNIRTQKSAILSGQEFKFRLSHNKSGFSRRMNTGSSIQGKYIWLQFEENKYAVTNPKEWKFNQVVNVTFATDSLGFAKISTVSGSKPAAGTNYIKARAFMNFRDSTSLQLQYPFNNYYIEDKDTRDINEAIGKKLNDSLTNNYLVVKIHDDHFLASDLVIDNLSFKEFVRKVRLEKKK